MEIKAYEDLTIQDNFLFQKVMRNKSICRRVIERLLDVEIRDIRYQEEEKVIDVRLDSKSIRLDVYVNDAAGTVFNIEMQTTKDMRELVKRTRYYQALLDIDLLEKGQDYRALNDTYIIFICTFGVFDGRRHKYSFRNVCLEDVGLELHDGAAKMFLSTKGEMNDVSRPLRNYLDYIDGQQPKDELIQEIDTEINVAKRCDEWRREYMTLELEIRRHEEEAEARGRAQGRVEGEAHGISIGEARGKLESIKSLMESMSFTVEQAMKALKIPANEYEKYMAMI